MISTFLVLASSLNHVPASDSSAFLPHPDLAVLEDGEAIDLGRYECESRVPDLRCETIFDFSRINYDPFNHRFVIFGGGHAATGRTDIDAFDMKTLAWRSLYPSMSCEQIAEGDVDPRGFHLKTQHPVARHSYDQNVVAEFGGHGWLLMFSTEGFAGNCHRYKASIQAPAAYALTDPDRGWSFRSQTNAPWGYAGSAEWDPVSGHIILLSSNSSRMWVFNPDGQEIVASVKVGAFAKNSSNLLYNPRDSHMYLIDRKTLKVQRFQLDRIDWRNTTVTEVATTGKPPVALRNFAYDSHNHVIGGISDNIFHLLDMSTFEWRPHPITERSRAGVRVGTVYGHAIDYDPLNNVFILVSGKRSNLRTWAYRYRK